MHNERRTILIQIGLFIATFITTTLAGGEWCFGKSIYTYSEAGIGFNPQYGLSDFIRGMWFSVPLLAILTVHEFGHYFTAIYHRVRTSLPYYLPIPPLPLLPLVIGTLGAVIRLRSKPRSSVQNFDIGLAGPLAGFVMTLIVLAYGFSTLPPSDYVFEFHPEYKEYGAQYAAHVYTQAYYDKHIPEGQALIDVEVGSTLIVSFFKMFVSDPSRIPNAHELIHYPVLLAGIISLFFTCLNLLPIGQLDGGHITYGLLGSRWHGILAKIFLVLLLAYAGTGVVTVRDSWDVVLGWGGVLVLLYYSCFKGFARSPQDAIMFALLLFAGQFMITWLWPSVTGYPGWLIFAFVAGRFIGVHYPPAEIEVPLDTKRVVLGWVAVFVFIVSFSPVPLNLYEVRGKAPAPKEQQEKQVPAQPEETPQKTEPYA